MTTTAQYWIESLHLLPHPEGGYYVETYRTDSGDGKRAASTGIYFLIEQGNISRLHRIDADEMWHFYAGDPLIVHTISPEGEYEAIKIGANPERDERFQAVVPAGYWFGAEMDADGEFALVGCTVAPGFEFSGFELADSSTLKSLFPHHSKLIEKMT